jgi:hypothetical protein
MHRSSRKLYDSLFSPPAISSEEMRDCSFERYVSQYDIWRDIARSLPMAIDVDAARDALRDEAHKRHACSWSKRLARRAGDHE